MTATEREVAIVGGFDADERIRDQERDGVTAEVIFPTFALQACFSSEDAGLQLALCRAYNDWAAEVFAGDPRLLAVGAVPMLDIDAAIDRGEAARRRRVPRAVPPGSRPAAPVQRRRVRPRSGRSPRTSACRSRSTPAPGTSRASCGARAVRSSTTCSARSSTARWCCSCWPPAARSTGSPGCAWSPSRPAPRGWAGS